MAFRQRMKAVGGNSRRLIFSCLFTKSIDILQ
nr:MAG TPA: hypothetical protein [Caudoviricetes sp.]DAQ22224.1 MAG TPA: hypothetical protein [Caudoviricetes sp.]